MSRMTRQMEEPKGKCPTIWTMKKNQVSIRSRSRSRSISKQRNRSRSRSRSPDNDLDEGSANYHIPKRNEFAMAESIVPPPPKRSKPEKRVRVALDDEHKEKQEAWLKGIYLTSQDKQVLLNQIPLPATVLALPSSLDDDLKALLGPDQFSGRTIQVSEKELYSLNELTVNAVNMLGFIKKLSASADSGTHLADDALGYLHTTGDILSVAIKDLIGMRRQLALGALGLKVQDVPSIKRLSLEGSARLDPKLDEYLPNLFGSVLKEELLAADSAVTKAVDRLKARNKPSPSKFVNKDKKAQSTDRRITASTSSRSYNNRLAVLSSSLVESNSKLLFRPGNFANCAEFWETMSTDPWVRRTVRGYSIPLEQVPLLEGVSTARPVPSTLDRTLEDWLSKGIFEPVMGLAYFSSMFGVPKKGGTIRPILNLKRLNKFIEPLHFKMEGLAQLKDIIRPNDWMIKIDFSDAYFGVNIAPKDRKFLALKWKGRAFQFTCMPFGLCTAPWVFTKLMTALATHLRESGVRLIHYLDDWLLVASSTDLPLEHSKLALLVFCRAGITVNKEKSIVTPARVLEFLGVTINSSKLCWRIPQDKKLAIIDLANSLLSQSTCSAQDVASFLGKVNFVALVYPYSKFFTRELQLSLRRLGLHDQRSYRIELTLPVLAVEELRWWTSLLDKDDSSSFTPFFPAWTLVTDASGSGWGAVCGVKKTGGRWSSVESLDHINVLELRAILFGLRTLGKNWANADILIESDNVSAVAYLRDKGGATSRTLSELAKQIWDWALTRGLRMRITHRPGVLNQEADFQSRCHLRETCEWVLDREIVLRIFNILGNPQIDLFATRLNTQCHLFYSYFADPESQGTDAFAQKWCLTLSYGFPPFNQIGKVLAKALKEQCELILVTPCWKSQPWFPLLVGAASHPPLLIPQSPTLLIGAEGQSHPLANQKNFRLLVWKIYASAGSEKDCLWKQQTRCWPVGLQQL